MLTMSPAEVAQLVEEEKEDVENTLKMVPVDLVLEPGKYEIKQRLQKLRLNSESMALLEQVRLLIILIYVFLFIHILFTTVHYPTSTNSGRSSDRTISRSYGDNDAYSRDGNITTVCSGSSLQLFIYRNR